MKYDAQGLTESQISAGCMELFAYNPDYDDPDDAVRRIVSAVLEGCRSFEQDSLSAHRLPKSVWPRR